MEVSHGQNIRGNIVKLYDFPSYESQVKKRIRQGAMLRTLFLEFRKETPLGESVIIAWLCRIAQETGKPYTLKALKRTLRLCEEQFDTETRSWLAQRVSQAEQTATEQKVIGKSADLPEVSLIENADTKQAEVAQ